MIIGNGFDLNLGLRTGYADFIASIHFPAASDSTALAAHLQNQQKLNNWVDVETELSRYSMQNPDRSSLLAEYKEICEGLTRHIASLQSDKIDRESQAFRLLTQIAGSSEFTVVNFNYTDTVEKILLERGVGPDTAKGRVRYLHGSVKDQNIIFGVDDSAAIGDEHAFLYKSTNGNFSGRGLTELLLTATVIHFFGHSLGDPDHMYFRDFFTHLIHTPQSGKQLIFHHHGEDGLYSLHRQLQKLTNRNVAKLKSLHEFIGYDVSRP
jgi:hypothetical protein